MSACEASGGIVAAAWKLIDCLTTAPSADGAISFNSATASASPEINATGTPKCPAIDALSPDSAHALPLMRTAAKVALEMVCARTPRTFVVAA